MSTGAENDLEAMFGMSGIVGLAHCAPPGLKRTEKNWITRTKAPTDEKLIILEAL